MRVGRCGEAVKGEKEETWFCYLEVETGELRIIAQHTT